MHTEVWFEIQYSHTGADDWFAQVSESTSDTLFGAQKKLERQKPVAGFEFRIVKKTLTEEVITQ